MKEDAAMASKAFPPCLSMRSPASVAMGCALATMAADEVSCFCCEKDRLVKKKNRMGKNCFMRLGFVQLSKAQK
jgi:hypothetical protein